MGIVGSAGKSGRDGISLCDGGFFSVGSGGGTFELGIGNGGGADGEETSPIVGSGGKSGRFIGGIPLLDVFDGGCELTGRGGGAIAVALTGGGRFGN